MRPLVRAAGRSWHELREREDGQTTTEYAILLGFLAIAIIIALFFLRNVLREPLLGRGEQRLERTELDTAASRRPDGHRRPPAESAGSPAALLFWRTKEAEGLVGTHPSAGCPRTAYLTNLSEPSEVRRATSHTQGLLCAPLTGGGTSK